MIVYVGFVIINIELIEIIVDGIFGTHRFLASIFGDTLYGIFTATLEVLATLVVIAVVAFFIRRNGLKIPRLSSIDLKGWPKNDANWILVIEFCLMMAFFKMNAADWLLQQNGVLAAHGSFPVSSNLIAPIFQSFGFSDGFLHFIERGAWWFHFVGILFFMNYLYYSKHLHILLAFPNTYFADLNAKGKLDNLESVTNEVKLMMDPTADPFAAPSNPDAVPAKFGASDVQDLNWVQLLNAYSCTECGRCTSSCPANQTGKKLSPRKIMMDTRDRLEEVGKNIDLNKGVFVEDGKSLLNDYITTEELWACTSCNACVEECPINISPLSIIIDMRRYLVMEQSAAPTELNNVMTNIENNGAPWQYNQMDRLNWANEE